MPESSTSLSAIQGCDLAMDQERIAVSLLDGNVVASRVSDDADAWEIEYANQIKVNASSTFIAAVVSLKRTSPAIERIERLQLWETGTGEIVWRRELKNSDNLAPSFGPDGRFLCFRDGDDKVRGVDTQSLLFPETQILTLPSDGSSGLS